MSEHEVIAEKVFAIVAKQTGISRACLTLDTDLHEQGVAGDDAEEILVMLQEAFGLDLSQMDFDRHFSSESGLSLSDLGWWVLGAIVYWLGRSSLESATGAQSGFLIVCGTALLFVIWLVLGSYTLPQHRSWRRQRIPVTIGDLVIAAETKKWPHDARL
jgi:hypothetical protein